MLEFVDVETARVAKGARMVVNGMAPSPWSEATKGLFRVAGIPALVVRRQREVEALNAWTGTDNAPVVFYDDEPVRTNWSAIVGLVARLAPGTVLPTDPAARAAVMGNVELIAGEDGIGWNVRLSMIHDGLATKGERGFPAGTAAYLSKRYGYTTTDHPGLRARIEAQLIHLRELLGDRPYFGGDAPNAIDVYLATFLTIVSGIGEAECPGFSPAIMKAFGTAHDSLASLLPASIVAHRVRMFEQHLAWPIQL